MPSTRAPATLLALGGGLVVATQARVNGQFGDAVGSPIPAAMLSAATGLAIVTLAVGLAPRARVALARIPAAVRGGALPWWALPAGTLGGFLLVSQTYAVPSLGVAIYSVLVVASLTAAGLLVDRVGLAPAGPQPVTPNRAIGAGLAVGAALLAAGPGLATASFVAGAAVVVVAAGGAAAVQSALLGRVGVGTGHPLAATWVNFVGAALALAAIVAVATATGLQWSVPAPSWLWLGGPLGVLIVGAIIVTVPRAGVLVVTLTITAGQLLGSVLWDWWAPVSGRGVDAWAVAGALLLMAAVALASARRS